MNAVNLDPNTDNNADIPLPECPDYDNMSALPPLDAPETLEALSTSGASSILSTHAAPTNLATPLNRTVYNPYEKLDKLADVVAQSSSYDRYNSYNSYESYNKPSAAPESQAMPETPTPAEPPPPETIADEQFFFGKRGLVFCLMLIGILAGTSAMFFGLWLETVK